MRRVCSAPWMPKQRAKRPGAEGLPQTFARTFTSSPNTPRGTAAGFARSHLSEGDRFPCSTAS